MNIESKSTQSRQTRSAPKQNVKAKPVQSQHNAVHSKKQTYKPLKTKPTLKSPNIKPAVQTDKKTAEIKTLLQKDGGISNKSYDTAVSEMHKLPDKLIDYLKETDCKIYISSYDLKRRVTRLYGKNINGEIEGAFLRFDNVIFLSQSHVGDASLHEIGHFVDYSYRFFTQSMKPEFESAFNNEKNKLFQDGYYLNDIHEYFAEAFRLYYDSPSNLKSKAPETYNYISKVLYKP